MGETREDTRVLEEGAKATQELGEKPPQDTPPLSWNPVLEAGDTSIIKQHPPRRPQALEKRGQGLRVLPGRRQHLHKLQMLDLTRRRREAELKRNLHREAKINKQKIKEFNPKKVLGNLQRSSSSESQDLIPAEPNHTVNGGGGNTRDRPSSEQHSSTASSPSKSKVDLWFRWEQPTRDLFWDSSSTDSEDWERDGKRFYHRPTLVRTKTERIPLFDELIFDKD
ncbi:factor associated with metabolism and energy [Eudromia elegans]